MQSRVVAHQVSICLVYIALRTPRLQFFGPCGCFILVSVSVCYYRSSYYLLTQLSLLFRLSSTISLTHSLSLTSRKRDTTQHFRVVSLLHVAGLCWAGLGWTRHKLEAKGGMTTHSAEPHTVDTA